MESSENLLVKASAEKFAKLQEALHALNPVKLIVDALARPEEEPTIIFYSIEQDERPSRLRQYMELGLVRKVGNGYTYGAEFATIQQTAKNDIVKLRESVISYVIRQFETYLHLGNCYYWPSLDAEKLLYTKKRSLYQRYLDYYGKLCPVSFPSLLEDLIQVGAIHLKDDYCYEDEELFEKMLSLLPEDKEVNPLRA